MALANFRPTLGSDIKLKSFNQLDSSDSGHNIDHCIGKANSNESNFIVTFDNIQFGFYKSTYDEVKSRLTGWDTGPDYKMILRGVSGHLRCGEMTALMGPSGAGKSILLECILGKRLTGYSGNVTCKLVSI